MSTSPEAHTPHNNPREASAHALLQARKAAKRGDAAGAERWTSLADRMARTAERLAALPPPEDDWRSEEARRADLRARIARFVEAEAAKAARGDDSETPF